MEEVSIAPTNLLDSHYLEADAETKEATAPKKQKIEEIRDDKDGDDSSGVESGGLDDLLQDDKLESDEELHHITAPLM